MILLCATLAACATQPTPRTVSDLCLTVGTLNYTLVPRAERDAAAAENRPVRDDGNKADSDATRASIGEHNARWRSVCEPTNSPAIRPGQ
jgi:hypothetical protein